MTKHRKGTTKPRKSIRNRNCKTRRQSGGGYVSFISADENITRGQKGIDVKVSTERHTNGTPMWWLIGGDGWRDATFGELKSGAKDGRYVDLTTILEVDKEFGPNMFTKFSGDYNTSKGISLNVDQFCRLLINGPLDYPKLRERFRNSDFKCLGSAAPSSAAQRAPSSAAQAQYDSNLQTIKDLGMNVTDGEIVKALKKANGNVDNAASILLAAVRPSGSTAPRQKPLPMTALSDIGMGGIASGAPRQLHDWPPPQYPPPPSAYHPPPQYPPPPGAYHPPPGAYHPR